MTRFLASAILAVVIALPAWAISPKGEYVGRFNYSCAQLIKMYEASGIEQEDDGVTFNRSFSVIIGWMAGYMSRVNATRRGQADFYANMAVEAAWIANWCETNKESDLMDGMQALTKERLTKGKPKPPPPATSPAGATPAKPGPPVKGLGPRAN